MTIWALSDPHLSFGTAKPMDVFGDHWQDHPELIRRHWLERVGPHDTVLIPGDISWGMNLAEALPDLRFLDELPGSKLLGRGNHDYWWNSLTKLARFCEDNGLETLRFMRSNAFAVENTVIANSRGWILPDDRGFNSDDARIYRRELIRLRLSLEEASRLRRPGQALIATLHYPPLNGRGQATELTELLEEFDTSICIYGHVHGEAARFSFNGQKNGIEYRNTACDYLHFRPLRLLRGPTADETTESDSG